MGLWQFKIMNHTQTVADREREREGAEPSQPQLGSRRGEARQVELPGLGIWLTTLTVVGFLVTFSGCSGLALGQHSDGIGASLAARAGAAAGACWEVSILLHSPPLGAALFWSGDSHLIACQQIVIVGISSPGQSQACATPPTGVGASSLHIVIEKFNQIIS